MKILEDHLWKDSQISFRDCESEFLPAVLQVVIKRSKTQNNGEHNSLRMEAVI